MKINRSMYASLAVNYPPSPSGIAATPPLVLQFLDAGGATRTTTTVPPSSTVQTVAYDPASVSLIGHFTVGTTTTSSNVVAPVPLCVSGTSQAVGGGFQPFLAVCASSLTPATHAATTSRWLWTLFWIVLTLVILGVIAYAAYTYFKQHNARATGVPLLEA